MKLLVVAALGLAACGATVRPGLGTGAGGASGGDVDAGPAGSDAGSDAATLTVTPADIARRLSLFLWERAPDADLLRQVYDPPVTTKAAVRALATKMLADPRARDGVRAFFHQWLKLDGLALAMKDPKTFPQDSPALRAAMVADAEAFALYVTFDGDGRFLTLFTADFGLLDATVAPLYGADVTGAERRKVALDPAQRSGVLTLPAVLANVKDGSLPPVSARGIFVLSLLCQDVPPSPPFPPSPPPAPSQTTRDWLQQVVSSPGCVACHNMMDPPGLAFGNYDALGRFSTTERGLPVDAQGSWSPKVGNDVTLTFNGARSFSTQLASLREVRRCFAQRWLTFGGATSVDPAAIDEVARAFQDASGDIRALIVAVTTTDAFLHP